MQGGCGPSKQRATLLHQFAYAKTLTTRTTIVSKPYSQNDAFWWTAQRAHADVAVVHL